VAILAALAMLVGVEEFSHFIRKEPRYDLLAVEGIAALILYSALQFSAASFAPVFACLVIGLMLVHLFTFKDIQLAGPMWMGSVASLCYAPLLMAFLPLVRGSGPDGLNWLFFSMLITWAGDTGAYLAGRAFGRHKFAPEVSPKKTWEGFFGGIALSIAAAFLARSWFFPNLTLLDCLVLAPLLDVVGVFGDLCESLLKRSAGIKDSGKIFPGHGGILDRVDSLLFSAPVLYAYLIWR
jgi:phosphatidate cytidylyltransferase